MALVAAVLVVGCGRQSDQTGSVAAPGLPRPAPMLGVDMIFQDAPHILLRAFAKPEKGNELAQFLESDLGLTSIRLNSFGFYSFLGSARSAELRRLTQQRNVFPWFSIDEVVGFVASHDLRIVAGLNPEDGPEAAVHFVTRFKDGGALDRIVAIELGNEPHLSKRPWQPEEYADACAEIIRALEPFGVRCAVSLTVGSESKTPTGISDDDYTRRELTALNAKLALANRSDIYGVVHLYARGVDPRSIDRLDDLVDPFAPQMRYLITEFNIRSSLKDNSQLTVAYGLEFIEKTSRLVAHPRVAGLFVHGVPYHSVAYWSGDSGIQTVSGFHDDRLTGDDLARGWHLTPAGRLYGLFARELWRGELLTYLDEGPVQVWSTRRADGDTRVGVINASDQPFERSIDVGGKQRTVSLPRRSTAVVSAQAGEVGRVELPSGP